MYMYLYGKYIKFYFHTRQQKLAGRKTLIDAHVKPTHTSCNILRVNGI